MPGSDSPLPGRWLDSGRPRLQEKVIGVYQSPVLLDLLSFDANIRDPMLATTVGAASDVKFQVLIEVRKPFIELFDQPAREALRFSDGQFAEFSAAAGDRAAPKGRAPDSQPDCIEFFGQLRCIGGGHIDDQQVLHVGRPQLAIREPIG